MSWASVLITKWGTPSEQQLFNEASLGVEKARAGRDGVIVPAPPLIDLSLRCCAEVARGGGGSLEAGDDRAFVTLTFPIAEMDP